MSQHGEWGSWNNYYFDLDFNECKKHCYGNDYHVANNHGYKMG